MTTTPTAPLTLDAAPEQLLPCPFCGSASILIDRPDGPLLVGAFAGCDACDIHTPIKPFAREAIAAWNRRAALSAQAATIAQLEASLREAEIDALRWDFVRHHWSNAQMRWNNDATNSLKSITLTIKTMHWTSGASDLEKQVDTAIAAHGKDAS